MANFALNFILSMLFHYGPTEKARPIKGWSLKLQN